MFETVVFEIEKEEKVEILFEERNGMYMITLKSSEGNEHNIPLLLESFMVFSTIEMLGMLELRMENYSFEFFKCIVSGAAYLSMKSKN